MFARRPHRLQPRSEVFSEKANFKNDNGGFVVGTHKKICVGIQEVSARRVRKELIYHSLYLFAWPIRVDYGWPFVNVAKLNKYICLHSRKHICIQGISLNPATV